jgi:malonyl-CoA decarboxylase
MSEPSANLLDRTLERLGRALRGAAGSARVRLTGQLRPDLPEDDAARLRRQIDVCLEGRGGEVSARARAVELGRTYLSLSAAGRQRFLAMLAQDYGVDPAGLDAAVATLHAATDVADRLAAEAALRRALVPPRLQLMTKFNILPEGVKFLVDMRADLLGLGNADPALSAFDRELRDLLASWFDIGFLDLERITWHAPAALLERLMAYEAVHKIRSWSDLKNRLDSDRRCYAFFHPRMPDEPLIFVEVALVNGMAGDIQALLDETAPPVDPAEADTAIFYSISNCQQGLAGVSFGNFLIKRVVDALRRDLPRLKVFATLSPVPGFRAWLDERLAAGAEAPILSPLEEAALVAAAGEEAAANGAAALESLLARPDWPEDPAAAAALEPPLMRLCARYLLEEKEKGRARDRVAHFHLSNGARVERLNWLGDRSADGLRLSAGLMVNYRYKLDDIEANHEAYTSDGKVAATSAVRRLLKT